MENCRLCGGTTSPTYKLEILKKYDIQYLSCESCGHFQTEKPYWLTEAYTEIINDEDLGIFRRNFFFSNFLTLWLGKKNPLTWKALDYSGGYGILVRLMRDQGLNFKWTDKYCENIFAKNATANTQEEKFDLVTSFEVLEHVEDPVAFVKELLTYGKGTLLLSTVTFKGQFPSKDWYYLGKNHGQHIGFFNQRSLEKLAQLTGVHLVSFRNMHLLSDRKYSRGFFIFCYCLAFFGIPQVISLLTRRKSLE